MSASIGGVQQVYNQTMPPGCIVKTIPIILVLQANVPLPVDLTIQQQSGKIDQIQACFIDNSNNTGELTLNTGVIQQNIKTKAATQGYFPILVTNPPQLIFTSTQAATVQVILINVPMPVGSWST